jgi:hypothetical protein
MVTRWKIGAQTPSCAPLMDLKILSKTLMAVSELHGLIQTE